MPESASKQTEMSGDGERKSGLDETTLVTALKQGDKRAFGQLVETYRKRLYTVVFRLLGSSAEAEDALQDTFVKVVVNISKFDGRSTLYTWLYRVAVNAALSRARNERRRKSREIPAAKLEEAGGEDRNIYEESADLAELGPEKEAMRRETVAQVREAIAGLPEGYREAIVMRDLEGMRYEEIAAAAGWTIPMLKSRLHRARMMLAEKFAPEDL